MGKPVALALGVAYAFPDVCETILPIVGKIFLPFPNIAQLDQASSISDANGGLLIGPASMHALLGDASIDTSTGDELGFLGGIVNDQTSGKCEIKQSSQTVLYGPEGKGIVRFMDMTFQNMDDTQPNAVGNVMSAFPTVLVGD